MVSAGNLLFRRERLKAEHREADRLKADLLLRGYHLTGIDALNVGAYDLSLGVGYLRAKQAEHRLPLLSANLRDEKGNLWFRPHVLKEVGGVKVGILGLTDPRLKVDKIPGGEQVRVQPPRESVDAAVRELKAQGATYLVLLTDMTSRSLRRLAAKGLPVDAIIASDERNQIASPFFLGPTYVTHLDRGGKCIGRLEVALLKPGQEPPPGTLRTTGRPGGEVAYRNTFVQLRLSIPDDPILGPLVAAVAQRVAELQEESSKKLQPVADSDCGKRYLGAGACVSCHSDRHRGWSATSHALAYTTLVKRKKQFDEDCLACHTLGFECEGGFFDPENLGGFAHVQCESCHGPGQVHVEAKGKAPMPTRRPSAAVCRRCHTEEKSPDLDLARARLTICRPAP